MGKRGGLRPWRGRSTIGSAALRLCGRALARVLARGCLAAALGASSDHKPLGLFRAVVCLATAMGAIISTSISRWQPSIRQPSIRSSSCSHHSSDLGFFCPIPRSLHVFNLVLMNGQLFLLSSSCSLKASSGLFVHFQLDSASAFAACLASRCSGVPFLLFRGFEIRGSRRRTCRRERMLLRA